MRFSLLALVFACVTPGIAQSEKPLLLQKPALNDTHIVFSYAGDLWTVSRDGGDATRLTAGAGIETDAHFSPDGAQIAFTGEYDGNVDVYVMPAAGGVPKRLTYHPAPDVVQGWSPDGKQILFRSTRNSYSRFARLFTMPAEGGGLPAEVPLPMAEEGAYSPDGSHLAYMPLARAFLVWKRYRGGRTTPIWIANLADSSIEKLPRQNSNDFNPMWVGSKVYFLSDRNGPVTLFAYDTRGKKVSELIHNTGLDIKSASAGPGAIVYEQFGEIHLYDLKTGNSRKVDIRLSGDLPEVRPRFEKVSSHIAVAGLSPTGARAVFEAHGEILTVPAEKGSIRNLSNTPGAAERDPAWSPDGKQIAYFSDESGEYQLNIRDQNGMGEVRKIKLGDPPSFYYQPVWSPDGKKIAYTTRLTLWYIDLEKKTPVRIDTDTYDSPFHDINPAWSPDSKWIAYTRLLKNHLRAVYLYALDEGAPHQVSDGMSDANYAAFDKNGKYLYFTASTNVGLANAWLDMSSIDRQFTSSVYVAVLSKDDPSPIAPESDDEKAEDKAKDAEKGKDGDKKADDKEAKDKAKEPVKVKIDLANIGQRILALPIPARDYRGLLPGKEGILFLVENPPGPGQDGPPSAVVHRFDLKTRKTEKLVENVRAFDVSRNGEKMLFRQGDNWTIAAASGPPKSGEGVLKLDDLEVRVDPREEWQQMYREVWRIERDFFYDPGLHGLDLRSAEAKYQPYLDRVASRADLTYLFQEMLGEISVGHMYVGGGAQPPVKRVKGGLLGADYKIENGRYRFARVYNGENWNPQLKAPLTQPGVNVVAGEYLLAVNGRDLRGSDDVYSYFEETAGKSVVLRVGSDPSGAGSREVTVVPVENEFGLRNLAWIEENRRKVDQMSGGRLAYVYLPNTAEAGYTNFNRYYFAQVGREGAVIDERFNGGGDVAEYIIDYLKRPLMSLWHTREGDDFTTPQAAIFGPKAMIINEYAGSGGDALPWMFREQHVGTLIGKRTWGGLVGIFNFPELMDGGFVTAPNLAFYSPTGEWDVENHGVPPDVEVEYDPAAVRSGHDPQLEKAVEIVLAELKSKPLPAHKRPKYPNYHRNAALASGGN
ncbi:MAG TPA: PDZ domain-containing protein [Bryobacteraceae bacterium]|nr:PDZ domain-containing protein [Bryobacteraceae bacterium]